MPSKVIINMASNSQVIGGLPLTGGEKPNKAFSKDRVCGEPECNTKLSMYNHGKYCYLHEPMTVPRTRGRKIA